MRTGQRGVTLLDAFAATALVGVTLLASCGLLLQWRQSSQQLERRAAAEHALAQEMDELLAAGLARLAEGRSDWRSGADRASGLPEARGEVLVEPFRERGLRLVSVRLDWEGGRAVRETLVGGGR